MPMPVCVYSSRKIEEKMKTVHAPHAPDDIAHLDTPDFRFPERFSTKISTKW